MGIFLSPINRYFSENCRWVPLIKFLQKNRLAFVQILSRSLTSRQTCEKLQCLYENQMSNNFRQTALLKKNINCNKATKQRIVLKKIGSVSVLKFLQRLALDFPRNFSRGFLTDTCIKKFKKWFQVFQRMKRE